MLNRQIVTYAFNQEELNNKYPVKHYTQLFDHEPKDLINNNRNKHYYSRRNKRKICSMLFCNVKIVYCSCINQNNRIYS